MIVSRSGVHIGKKGSSLVRHLWTPKTSVAATRCIYTSYCWLNQTFLDILFVLHIVYVRVSTCVVCVCLLDSTTTLSRSDRLLARTRFSEYKICTERQRETVIECLERRSTIMYLHHQLFEHLSLRDRAQRIRVVVGGFFIGGNLLLIRSWSSRSED